LIFIVFRKFYDGKFCPRQNRLARPKTTKVRTKVRKEVLSKPSPVRQIRKVLTKSGLKVKPDELQVLRQDGDRLHCVFLFSWGAPGVVTAPPGQPIRRSPMRRPSSGRR
jgi:hypothetical protein